MFLGQMRCIAISCHIYAICANVFRTFFGLPSMGYHIAYPEAEEVKTVERIRTWVIRFLEAYGRYGARRPSVHGSYEPRVPESLK